MLIHPADTILIMKLQNRKLVKHKSNSVRRLLPISKGFVSLQKCCPAARDLFHSRNIMSIKLSIKFCRKLLLTNCILLQSSSSFKFYIQVTYIYTL